MKYRWTFSNPLDRQGFVILDEQYGVCITDRRVAGGFQCVGNGMLTVIRYMIDQLGYTPIMVRELE